MTAYFGEIAALATALLWAFGSIFFTNAGKIVGSVVVNRTRLVFAFVMVAATHFVFFGTPAPLDAEPYRWGWLALSGVIGYAVGDAFLFQAFVMIGPRISMLLMSLVPIISAGAAWLFLGEDLSWEQVAAILLTVAGVLGVVMDRAQRHHHQARRYAVGIAFGLGGAFGQAFGLIAAKNGLAGDFSPVSANFIRLGAAAVAIWIFTILRGKSRATIRALGNRTALKNIAAGAFVGPFIGVSLSLLAIQLTYVGVASALMATTPIWMLPIVYRAYGERISLQVTAGTTLAVIGVAILFYFQNSP